MPDQGHLSAKVRAYMEALSPSARVLLAKAMQSAQQRGDQSVPNDAILKAFGDLEPAYPVTRPAAPAAAMAASAAPAQARSLEPWDAQVQEAIFAPIAPFVCDVTFTMKQPARISADSVAPIWTWFTRDLAPRDFALALSTPTLPELADATMVARRLRRAIVPKIIEKLRSAEADAKTWRRLAAQLGGEIVLHDLADVVYVFQHEGSIVNFSGQLPKIIASPDASEVVPTLDLVKKTIDEMQVDPSYMTVLMMQRAGSAAIVAAMAMRLANSSDPRFVQTSPYGRIIDTVISEVELWTRRAEVHIASPAQRVKVFEDVRSYHDLVRQLELTISPEQVPLWHRRLGAARKHMSDLIGKEIEPLAGLIRRATRVEGMSGHFNGHFDQDACDDAEFGAKLFAEARMALDSLALNELIAKTRKQVEQTLEMVTNKLMSDFKSGAVMDKSSMLKAIDGIIRICAVIFGEDYAALLRKSRDLAVSKSSSKTGS